MVDCNRDPFLNAVEEAQHDNAQSPEWIISGVECSSSEHVFYALRSLGLGHFMFELKTFFLFLVVLVEKHAAHGFMWDVNENLCYLCSKGPFLNEINFRKDYKSYKHDRAGIRI